MIELHRRKTDPFADDIEEKLLELVVSFRKKEYTNEDDPEYPLPYINESGKVFQGEARVGEYLAGLEKELHWQRSITGDACYLDPETGEVC